MPKAKSGDFNGRFREIISYPLNNFIRRHPFAGHIFDGRVTLHNGQKAPFPEIMPATVILRHITYKPRSARAAGRVRISIVTEVTR